MRATDPEEIRRNLPPIGENYSKFDRGRLLLVAGSYGMAGACVLSARAALRSGVGYLEIFLPDSIYEVVTSAVPEAVCSIYRADDLSGIRKKLSESVKKADAVAAGPGLGTLREVLLPCLYGLSGKKLLLDADALNWLSMNTALSGDGSELSAPECGFSSLCMTPHSGEMARLLHKTRPEIENSRLEAVRAAARLFHASVLLKGQNTLISAPARECMMNPTGNAGLGRAGSGDTLTGIAGALLSQGMDGYTALYAAAWIHGRAGDLCREQLGLRSYLPSDVIEMLPRVFSELEERRTSWTTK